MKPKFYVPERDGITQGLLMMWMECRFKAKFFLQGVSPRQGTAALTSGSIGHGFLEHVYKLNTKKALNPAVLRIVAKNLEKQWKADNPRPNEKSLKDLEMALAHGELLTPLYFDFWKKDNFKWLGLEQSFKVPVETPKGRKTFLRGKFDGVFEKSLKPWLFETKFKALIVEGDLVDYLPFDFQIKLYMYAIKRLFKKVPAGVLYNLVRRIGLEKKQTETFQQYITRCKGDVLDRPDHYFKRYEVSFEKSEMEMWEDELMDMLDEFIDWWEGKIGHYRNPGACLGKYGRCPYLNFESGDRLGYTKREKVFRELEDL